MTKNEQRLLSAKVDLLEETLTNLISEIKNESNTTFRYTRLNNMENKYSQDRVKLEEEYS